MSIFSEDSKFSFRKLWSITGATLFATAVIGNLIANDFDEIPGAYSAILVTIVGFYFLRNKNITIIPKK